jgi:ligand-binding SRPBCC domain-containing protein
MLTISGDPNRNAATLPAPHAMARTFSLSSIVAAPAKDVWQWVTSPAGINHELMPILRMTIPRGMKGKGIDDLPIAEGIGRSWLLLFGCVPVDFDDITIVEREDGRRFLEKSTMLSLSYWEHERTVTESEGGCEVTDRITFRLRSPLDRLPHVEAAAAMLLRSLFAHRHRRLVRRFDA